jgi:outer membrane immunogenic protein
MRKLLGSKLLAAALVLSTFAAISPVGAADMPLKAPPPLDPIWTWTGFYVGGNVGYSWGRDSTGFNQSETTTTVLTDLLANGTPRPGGLNGLTVTNTTTGAGGASGDMNGWLGGFQAGYNWQRDRWVLGLETDFQWTGEKDDPTFCSLAGCPTGSFIGTNSTKLPWFGTLRGRVGITSEPSAMWGPLLLYVTGGLAYGRIEENYTMGLVGGPIGAVGVNTTRAGWTVGGGGETRIGRSNWTFKVEYLYMDFGNVSGGVSATGAPLITPILINSDFIRFLTTTTAISGVASTHVTDQLIRAGVNYHFGGL